MTDIVDRLRAMAGPIVPNVCTDAADEIERLTRERNAAVRVLRGAQAEIERLRDLVEEAAK
ncbi:MAG: hypothetical protein OEV43_00505 [Coriobacteriia bacterium]|nr:hypothetical protein [Coriobacteriia bacterium]